MSKGQWTILYIEHTTPTTCKPTNMCISSICQEQEQYPEKMFPTNHKASSINIPTPIAPNVWIITSSTTAVPSGITLICPGEAPRTITLQTPIHILQLQPAYCTTSQNFHLPPCYESHEVTTNIPLNTVNLNVVNVSAPEFRIWKHLEDHWNWTLIHHLFYIPSVPTDKLYKQMITSNGPVNPFLSTDESIGETVSAWTLFFHAGVYITAIGLLIQAGLGYFVATSSGADLPDYHADLYNQVLHDILLWMIM